MRELKNIAEQISVLTVDKHINAAQLKKFIPEIPNNRLPMVVSANGSLSGNSHDFSNEREILYKLFFDMKKDVTELKKMFVEILQNPSSLTAMQQSPYVNDLKEFRANQEPFQSPINSSPAYPSSQPVMLHNNHEDIQHHEEVEESLSIMDKEKELIIKALKKHKGKRKDASSDLGISERTLYRKLKEYDIAE